MHYDTNEAQNLFHLKLVKGALMQTKNELVPLYPTSPLLQLYEEHLHVFISILFLAVTQDQSMAENTKSNLIGSCKTMQGFFAKKAHPTLKVMNGNGAKPCLR